MKYLKFVTIIGCIVLLDIISGCSVFQKEYIGKKYFDLNVDLPPVKDTSGNQYPIIVKEFSINPAYDSHSFILRINKNEYTSDYYNEFVSYPASLITEKITENLGATPYFSPAPAADQKEIMYRLSGKIKQLYGDYQKSIDPKAVMEIRMILEKKTTSGFEMILNKSYLIQEAIPSRNPAQLVSGWNRGLGKIIVQFLENYKAVGF